MATNLFVSSGAAAKYTTGAPALLVGIKVAGKNNTSLVDAAGVGILITGIAMSQGARVAYFNTLSEAIYVYPLGNKVGKCIVTGTVFPKCGAVDEYSNVKKLMDFYNSNKASTFENVVQPIKISIGSTVLAGFLEDMQVNITNEANMFGSASFSLMLAIMPEEAT